MEEAHWCCTSALRVLGYVKYFKNLFFSGATELLAPMP